MTRREWMALSTAPLAVAAETQTIDQFFETVTNDWMRDNPEGSTAARFFPPAEQDILDGKLSPDSAVEGPARIAKAKKLLAELKKFDQQKLETSQRVSADILAWMLNDIIGQEPFLELTFPINQFRGVQVGMTSLLAETQPIRNYRDAENFLARLEGFGPLLDKESETMRKRASRGIRPPSFIIAETVAQMQRFITPAPANNIITTAFSQKLAKAQMPDAAKFVSSANKIMSESVYPAYRRALDNLATIGARANANAGLSSLPNGGAAYAFYLHRFTTTDMSPEQVHQLGLSEVRRIESEMEALLKPLGYTEGPIEARFKKLSADNVYPDSPKVREQILADYTEIIRLAKEQSASDFLTTPKANCIVQRIPEFQESNAAANYQAPPADGTRPGIFRVPLPGPVFTKVGMRTLAYHEAIPGHHFQVALQVENRALPKFRQTRAFGGFSAYSEGWGLYAERLAAELGWYKGDPVSDLGRLNGELFRARRLVTDTGLHTKGWTREQAIAYGIPRSEVDRYVVMPGQACSYKIGQLKILELRKKYQAALGVDYSPRFFHETVLQLGAVPLSILEEHVNWTIKNTPRSKW